jgi:hypothetical protein
VALALSPGISMTVSRTFAVASATLILVVATLAGCTPTVKVATDEPITINLNVNIRHEILVKVDKRLDSVIDDNSDIF